MTMFFGVRKLRLPSPGEALPGRPERISVPARHAVHGRPLVPPFPAGLETALLGMGCFWGAEKRFWPVPGVFTTAAGYAGGLTPNPTYREVCTGKTGHAEVVLVVFDPAAVPYEDLLRVFFESHDPTQGMRQGNDVWTQYRSALYVSGEERLRAAGAIRDAFQQVLSAAGLGEITTEIRETPPFYYAEEEHQQYLAKNPDGSCGLEGTGLACPRGIAAAASKKATRP